MSTDQAIKFPANKEQQAKILTEALQNLNAYQVMGAQAQLHANIIGAVNFVLRSINEELPKSNPGANPKKLKKALKDG